MLESLIALGVILVVVCLSEAAEARGIRVPILGRIFELLAEAMWRLWLLLIALTIVAIALVVAFDASGVPIVAWLAGVVALVAVVAVARRVFDWRFDGLVRRSDRTHRRYPVERRIEDAHSEGWEALKRRRFEQAASAYREAADLGDVDAMVNLANILSDELDSSDEAERWYRRAIQAGSTTAAENLALQRLDEDRVEEAQKLFELARRGGDSAGYIGLADIAVDEGELERARALLEIAIIEGELDAYCRLGDVLASLGRDAEAEQRLREGLALGAKGVTPVLAQLLRTARRDDEASAARRPRALHRCVDEDRAVGLGEVGEWGDVVDPRACSFRRGARSRRSASAGRLS
jgi:uncharacterized protein HemY